MSVSHYPMFIDGEWVDSLERYEIRSPATDELIATVAKGETSHIDRAVAAAKAAHHSGVWRDKPPEERAVVLDQQRLAQIEPRRFFEVAFGEQRE